jgi:hypothetical protein
MRRVRYIAAMLAVAGLFALVGCASAHHVVTITNGGKIVRLSHLPKGCVEIRFGLGHKPRFRSIHCSGYHPVSGKKH